MAKEQAPKPPNLYSRLGINRKATDEQVRTAYYRLAKVFHPDRRKGSESDEEAFTSIVRAAAILRDPRRRRLYDRGAIDEEGLLSRPKARWFRWSYREWALACLTAAMTVSVSGVAFYSLQKSEKAQPYAGVPPKREDQKLGAGTILHSPSLPLPAEQVKDQELAPNSDDSSASNQKNPQKSAAVLQKPVMAKQRSKIHSNSSGTILSLRSQDVSRRQSECSLTTAARHILTGILSR
jgi:curved DNA-binding protein CbpA